MSIAVGVPVLEAFYCLACTRWAYKRCTYTGADDSKSWTLAQAYEIEPIPRFCQLTLAVYEEDLSRPSWAPPGGYQIDLKNVVKKIHRPQKPELVPYLIYLDHDHKDIVLAIRGLNLRRENDYLVLWDNKLGKQMFDGGYVHHGLLKAAVWMLNKEKDTLRELILKHVDYTLTYTGHSLGSGIAALLAILSIKFPFLLGNIHRKRVRCYAIAPARCTSLNIAVKYADVINSVILQDDFLPRTATPLEDIFGSVFCLPCLLGYRCIRDTCISEQRLLRDERRLYVPGRIYHIVERKFCSCVKEPPEVRTGIPVEGRFEHIVLSCNATQDHSIVAILRESNKALQVRKELQDDEEDVNVAPGVQRMSKQESRKKEQNEEHKAALKRAVTLDVARESDGDVDFDDEEETHQEKNSTVDTVAHAEVGDLKSKMQWDALLDQLCKL